MASRMEDQDNVGRSAVLWIECDDGKLKIIRKILSFLRKAWTVPNVEVGHYKNISLNRLLIYHI